MASGGHLEGDLGFYNDSAMDANSRPPRSDEFQRAAWEGLQNGSIRTLRDFEELQAKYGFVFSPENREKAAKAFEDAARGIPITGVNPAEFAVRPISELRQNAVLPEWMDATARGAAGFAGLDDEIDAIATTAIHGGEFRQNLSNSRAIRDYDEENNFWPRLGGELAGGLAAGMATPSRIREAASLAARQVIRMGGSREAALAAARRAVAIRSAQEGAAFGAVAGFGEADGNVLDRTLGALGGGAAGGVAGGALGAVGARFAQPRMARQPVTDGQQAMQAADRLSERLPDGQNLDLLPADVGGAATRRITSGTFQTPFGVGPLARASNRVIERGRAALDNVAASVGQASDLEAAGDAARRGAMRYIRQSGSRIGRVYDTASAMSRDARIELTGAKRMLDEQIARLEQNPTAGRALEEARQLRRSLDGEFTVQGVRDMRTEMFVAPELRGTPIERRMRQVVDAAGQDIEQGLRSQGLGDAANAFASADRQWRQRLKTIDRVLEPIIGKHGDDEILAAKSGEEIANALTRAAKGNSLRLQRFLETIPEDEASLVRATLIGRLGLAREGAQNADGTAFSLSTFLTNWNKMNERARRAVFGDEARAALNDLATVASASREAQRFANSSNTAGANAVNLTSGSLGAAVISLLTGNFTAAAALASPAATQAISGRLLASPRFARWLARAPRTQLSAPAYIDRLSRIARAEPAIAGDILSLQRHLTNAFSGAPSKLAAEQGEQESGGVVGENNEGAEQRRQPELAPVIPGNIDLGNRPVVRNGDGSISTIRSMSFGTDQGEVLVPTVTDDGRLLTDEQAIEQYRRTGRHLGIFKTPSEADDYARRLSAEQGRRYLN
ncbi:hypothetical protein [Sphingomonas sp.]|uniref:hypothetical protein n=1 Tax=Sphingomonas sp. TaxID=28214 RepID=UPI0031E0020A